MDYCNATLALALNAVKHVDTLTRRERTDPESVGLARKLTDALATIEAAHADHPSDVFRRELSRLTNIASSRCVALEDLAAKAAPGGDCRWIDSRNGVRP